MAEKFKEGISVKELENFARKHVSEVFSILALILAAFSSMFDFFTGPLMSIAFATLGAIVSIAFVDKTTQFVKKISVYLFRQDKKGQYIIGAIRIVIALFLPFIIFAEIGILAGISFQYIPKYLLGMNKENAPKKESSSGEEHL